MFRTGDTRSSLRLAVVANPRSGNMWLRRLLVELYGLEERSAHTPAEVRSDDLPARCVLQIHWPPERAFRRQLRAAGLRVVVLVRHPLDALVSILHFAGHEPETARWLDGAHGDESSIIGADPTSDAFFDYAVDPDPELTPELARARWAERAAPQTAVALV